MNIPILHVNLDNGHGNNTTGKRSPDGRLMEWSYAREITKMIKEELDKYVNFDTKILVPEDWDVTLKDRVLRNNNICKAYGMQNCIFLSIHCNAAGNGGWKSARGWSGWVYRNASKNTKILADHLFDVCESLKLKTRKPLPAQKWWDCGFYVCRYTNCPAVLTENFFQDNKEDVEFLLSEEGKKKVCEIHVEAIKRYYKDVFGEEPSLKSVMGYGGCAMK